VRLRTKKYMNLFFFEIRKMYNNLE
jgi:hypothetical protein